MLKWPRIFSIVSSIRWSNSRSHTGIKVLSEWTTSKIIETIAWRVLCHNNKRKPVTFQSSWPKARFFYMSTIMEYRWYFLKFHKSEPHNINLTNRWISTNTPCWLYNMHRSPHIYIHRPQYIWTCWNYTSHLDWIRVIYQSYAVRFNLLVFQSYRSSNLIHANSSIEYQQKIVTSKKFIKQWTVGVFYTYVLLVLYS